jgi:SAM-dependent methyltransferase
VNRVRVGDRRLRLAWHGAAHTVRRLMRAARSPLRSFQVIKRGGTGVTLGRSILADVDLDDSGVIRGHVIDADHPRETLLIDILFDDILFRRERVAGVVDYRVFAPFGADFARLARNLGGMSSVAASFEFVLSAFLPRDREMSVKVKLSDGPAVLLERRVRLGAAVEKRLRERARRVWLGRLTGLRLDAGALKVQGVMGRVGDGEAPRLFVDDRPVDPSLVSVTPIDYRAQASFLSGTWFHVQATLPGAQAEAGIVWAGTPGGERLTPLSSGLLLALGWRERASRWKFPADHQVRRVAAHDSGDLYFFSGMATAATVGALVRRHAPRADGTGLDVLDWGCGCARVTQHLLEARPPHRLTGVDIDPENVAWCRQNVEGASFEQVGLQPPTRFDAASFDVVLGVSVMTHLTEADADAWLAELARLLRPGGLAILTVSSLHALLQHAEAAKVYQTLLRRGIDDEAVGFALDDVLDIESVIRYRETVHDHDYIRRRWSRSFDVVEIHEGLHFNHQDYVVLRRRPTATHESAVPIAVMGQPTGDGLGGALSAELHGR